MKHAEGWWQSFRETAFRQNCSNIKLSKNGTLIYEGPGELWQESDGTLAFKCFSRDETGRSVREMFDDFALPVGKLIPNETYYSLHLETMHGEVWSAERISVACNYSLPASLAVVTGKLGWLKQVRRLQSRPRKSAQDDKWSFCLTAGTLCPANQERQ